MTDWKFSDWIFRRSLRGLEPQIFTDDKDYADFVLSIGVIHTFLSEPNNARCNRTFFDLKNVGATPCGCPSLNMIIFWKITQIRAADKGSHRGLPLQFYLLPATAMMSLTVIQPSLSRSKKGSYFSSPLQVFQMSVMTPISASSITPSPLKS